MPEGAVIRFLRSLTSLGRTVLALALLVCLAAGLLAWQGWRSASTAKVETRLNRNQTEAALQSGKDATVTVGQQSETEAARERSVAEMQKDVNDAENVPDAHAAGTDWLCDNFGICAEE